MGETMGYRQRAPHSPLGDRIAWCGRLADQCPIRKPLSVDFFDEPGHVLAGSSHCLDTFYIVFHLSGVSTDGHIPVTGTSTMDSCSGRGLSGKGTVDGDFEFALEHPD
jgi:hypothetical protein